MSHLATSAWNEFLLKIKKAKEDLGNPEVIWFRGQGDASNYLLPSLLRYTNGIEKEQSLFHKFQRFSDRQFGSKKSEWETLFDMQHYGLPTRLLDWSESLGIALYFAVYNNRIYRVRGDAAIYIINPIALNKESGKDKILNLPFDEKDFSYTGIYWNKNPFKANAPIAIEPVFNNDRIYAQRGTFTVSHDFVEPIEDRFTDAIKKVILPIDTISAASEFLEIANINEYSVFPDLTGVSDYLFKTSGLIRR